MRSRPSQQPAAKPGEEQAKPATGEQPAAKPGEEQAKPATGEQPAAKPGEEQAKPATGEQPKTGEQAALAEPHERIDGLRSWVAQVDRKLGIRTYALGAACVLGLAGAAVALVLTLQTQEDAATKDEADALRTQIEEVERSAFEATEEGVASLSERLDAVEGRVSGLRGDLDTTTEEISVIQDDIDELRDQISQLETDVSDLESAQTDTTGTDTTDTDTTDTGGDSGGTP
jgi:polyhydroxyalkanoate synthesis regulator phasin